MTRNFTLSVFFILMMLLLSAYNAPNSVPKLLTPANHATLSQTNPTFNWDGTSGDYTIEFYDCTPGTDNSILLSNYTLDIGPINISGTGDLSGLSYNEGNNLLYGIDNSTNNIFEMDTDGNVIRMIELNGFDDTEAIAYMGNGEFAIAEERRGRITFINIGTSLSVNYPSTFVQLNGTWNDNSGLEGLGYDAATNTMYVIEEYASMAIYAFTVPSSRTGTISPTTPFNIQGNYGFTDLSGLHQLNLPSTFTPHQFSENILILSDNNMALVEVNPANGIEISRLGLGNGGANNTLINGVPQPEGVTVDSDGNIYIVSEPNHFYRFKRSYFPYAPPVLNSLIHSETVSVNNYQLPSGLLDNEVDYCWRIVDNTDGSVSEEWSFTIHPSLPLELTRFEVNSTNKQALISWTTQSEVNIEKFEIERSTDAINYEYITALNATGSEGNTASYEYSDYLSGNGTTYYRLKIIETDGSSYYSDIRSVNTESVDVTFDIFPNPVHKKDRLLMLELDNPKYAYPLHAEIMNIDGQIIYDETFTLETGYNVFPIRLSNNISSGIYIVRVNKNGNMLSKKLLIQ